MNIEYIIKKCQGFGFVSKIKDIKMSTFGKEKPNLVFLKDPQTKKYPSSAKVYTNLDNLYDEVKDLNYDDERLNKSTVFIVELGVPTQIEQNTDISIPKEEIDKIIDEFEIKIDLEDEKKEMFKNTLKDFVEHTETYLNFDFNPTFIQFLQDIYPKIFDTHLQRVILKILVRNGIRVDELIRKHPLQHGTKTVDTVRQTEMFDDLRISDAKFDKSKNDIEDENIDSVSKDFMTFQSISRFHGFGNSFAQVDNTKKRANIPDVSALRNHAVIHSLARNKIVSTPEIYKKKDYSLSKLEKILSKFQNFHVIFIWPNYEGVFNYDTYPSRKLEIAETEGNVILLVFFRFMAINFFGMHETIDHEDMFVKYLL